MPLIVQELAAGSCAGGESPGNPTLMLRWALCAAARQLAPPVPPMRCMCPQLGLGLSLKRLNALEHAARVRQTPPLERNASSCVPACHRSSFCRLLSLWTHTCRKNVDSANEQAEPGGPLSALLILTVKTTGAGNLPS